jgi:hypothetical protein
MMSQNSSSLMLRALPFFIKGNDYMAEEGNDYMAEEGYYINHYYCLCA